MPMNLFPPSGGIRNAGHAWLTQGQATVELKNPHPAGDHTVLFSLYVDPKSPYGFPASQWSYLKGPRLKGHSPRNLFYTSFTGYDTTPGKRDHFQMDTPYNWYMGGRDKTGVAVTTNSRYSIPTLTILTVKAFTMPMATPTAYSVNGFIYVKEQYNVRYDELVNTMTTRAPTASWHNEDMTYGLDSYGICIHYNAAPERYSDEVNAWLTVQGADFHKPQESEAMFVIAGTVYFAGVGNIGTYDYRTGTESAKGALNNQRKRPGGVTVRGHGLIYGGGDEAASACFDTIESYDPLSSTSHTLGTEGHTGRMRFRGLSNWGKGFFYGGTGYNGVASLTDFHTVVDEMAGHLSAPVGVTPRHSVASAAQNEWMINYLTLD